jgi:pullulanase/glycogen debranching enzyme
VFSSVAEAVELCLFDDRGDETRQRLDVDEGFIWRGHANGIGPGTRYRFRVHGPWDPAAGLRCNPDKLLHDPYARAIAGGVRWHPAVYGDNAGDSAPYVPGSVVCADTLTTPAAATRSTPRLPEPLRRQHLSVAVDTTPQSGPARVGPGDEITVGGRALVLLENTAREPSAPSP